MSLALRSVSGVTDTLSTATTIRNVPDALLLDFGGVLFETAKPAGGKRILAQAVCERIRMAGLEADVAEIERSLSAGLTALKHWKHAQSRRRAPTELPPREIVGDFLASDLAEPARELLVAEASDVLVDVTRMLSTHTVRPGIAELLDLADARGIPVGIVSNAHSGRSHRQVLAEHGLEGRFAVQCYSDEVGLRKPHPGIIALAADACGTTPGRCWYVGDTQDRDVVAGRRAGVGAVILTRSHHTDTPPFAVADAADAVFETPEGVAGALREATSAADPVAPAETRGRDAAVLPDAGAAGAPRRGRALLIDHGGVISSSSPDPALFRDFCAWLADLLAPRGTDPDQPLDADDVAALVAGARERHREFKRVHVSAHHDLDEPLAEVDPVEFWRDWFGASLSVRRRAVLTAEAHDIMARFGRAKSRRTLRDGVRELLVACRDERIPVVVVSNTISGRAVRDACRDHGVDHLIAAFVCSDEVGVRKPDARLVQTALRVAHADPLEVVFLGDKPQNDAAAARRAGIAERVLVRGGTATDDALEAAADSGLATRLIDEPRDLIPLMIAVPAL